MNNYIFLRQYLSEVEKHLFEIINNYKQNQKLEIEYIINTQEDVLFNVDYIKDIYDDNKKLYKINYNYNKYIIENTIKYIFEIMII